MPSTLTGLLLFVVLLAPGFTFVAQRGRRLPSRKTSIFYETALLTLSSLTCDALALGVFVIVRAFFPDRTPDLGRLVRDGTRYFDGHYATVTYWGLALLVLASAIGFVLGRWPPKPLIPIFADDIQYTSSWWELFEDPKRATATKFVGCELIDGSYVAGGLARYNSDVEETEDRELTLAGPITYRPPGATAEAVLPKVDAVTVSARRIKFMTVTYV